MLVPMSASQVWREDIMVKGRNWTATTRDKRERLRRTLLPRSCQHDTACAPALCLCAHRAAAEARAGGAAGGLGRAVGATTACPLTFKSTFCTVMCAQGSTWSQCRCRGRRGVQDD